MSNEETALQIYRDLIKRIKAKVHSEIRYVYDPSSGIRKEFLHGKLISVKRVRET